MEKVEVDFDAKKATVTCKAGASLDRDSVAKAFDGSHYSIETFGAE